MCILPILLPGRCKENGREVSRVFDSMGRRARNCFWVKPRESAGCPPVELDIIGIHQPKGQCTEDTGQARYQSSRLETRTKEFDMYASVRV